MTIAPPTLALAVAISVCSAAAPPPAERALPVFDAAPAAAVLKHWRPQYGSARARIDAPAPDGRPALTFPANFAKPGDRACWDWFGALDLSKAGRIRFDLFTSNRGVTGVIGIYFGTPTGWYARFLRAGPDGAWTPVAVDLADFKTEGKPGGWDRVDRFRFSVWAAAPGKALYRLRNLRTAPKDPAENRLLNGSFEIHGGGMPYAWGSGHWGIGRMPWAANMALWRRHWHLDPGTARDGTTSLRIDNAPDLPRLEAWSVWFSLPATPKTWTASVWLKADRDGLPVRIQCGKGGTFIRAGRSWRQAAFHLPPGKRLRLHIAPQAAGTLWIDAAQVQACPRPTPEFHPAFDDPAIAAREAAVDWSPPRRTPEIARGRRIRGPTRPATVRIDRYGRFLVNGKPYLQHSLGLEFIADPAILDFVARSGFKDVCIQVHPGISTAQLRSWFDRCARAGLRLIPWLDGRIPLETFQNHIRVLKNHPALLCWYVYDEPSGAKFAAAEKRLALARKLDPHHPAYINYLGSHL